jgi:hypothetical protein
MSNPSLTAPSQPHLNGKAGRSHLTDKQEFYQLIEYTDDIDISKKLNEWKSFTIVTVQRRFKRQTAL